MQNSPQNLSLNNSLKISTEQLKLFDWNIIPAETIMNQGIELRPPLPDIPPLPDRNPLVPEPSKMFFIAMFIFVLLCQRRRIKK